MSIPLRWDVPGQGLRGIISPRLSLIKHRLAPTFSVITKNDIVYVAGPMTGLAKHNYPAFHRMEQKLKARFQCTVLNPARNF